MNRRSLFLAAIVLIVVLGGAVAYFGLPILQSGTNVPDQITPVTPTQAAALATAAPIPTVIPSPIPTQPPTPEPTAAPTEVPLVELPPPLVNAEFPAQTIDYPSDWPAELRYPEQFALVQVGSGAVPDGGAQAWAAKLLYHGSPASATNALSAFFTANGWTIAERTELPSGGFTLLIRKNADANSGIITVGPDPKDQAQSRIIAAVFP